jgi:hypothetical protein
MALCLFGFPCGSSGGFAQWEPCHRGSGGALFAQLSGKIPKTSKRREKGRGLCPNSLFVQANLSVMPVSETLFVEL